jgi:ATP-dependent Clp protease ATP-binding subunit ClpA
MLDTDLSIANAAMIARKERASQIDQRHLLLALLADKNTGTMNEIAKSLSATSRESIQASARGGSGYKRPVKRSTKTIRRTIPNPPLG